MAAAQISNPLLYIGQMMQMLRPSAWTDGFVTHVRKACGSPAGDKQTSKMPRPVLMWIQLQVLVAMATNATRYDNYTAPPVINVGLLQPLEGPLGFERTGSAATMAVRDAQRRGYLNQTDVR